jgi:hypothetical protein
VLRRIQGTRMNGFNPALRAVQIAIIAVMAKFAAGF